MRLNLLDSNTGKRQGAVGSLRFEFAKRNLAIPAGLEMMPRRNAEFRKTECHNRMIFEIVDFHSPRLLSRTFADFGGLKIFCTVLL
jgi:hypothetical protein